MKCFTCHNVANFKCGNCLSKFYCGIACQTRDWHNGGHALQCESIGLVAPGIDDPDIVGIETSDGGKFEIPMKLAAKMETIRVMLEEFGSDNYIPISLVDGESMVFIVKHLFETDATENDQHTFEEVQRLNNDIAVKLFSATNYLNYPLLLQQLLPKMATVLDETTKPAQFRSYINAIGPNVLPMIVLFFSHNALVLFYNKFTSFFPNQRPTETATIERIYNDVRKPYDDNWAIKWASENGLEEAVRLLLDTPDKVPTDSSVIRPAQRAAEANGHSDIVEMLKQYAGKRQRIKTKVQNYK